MKGMEGGADSDGKIEITARELHAFVRENVVQQSGGSQVPELQGDGETVISITSRHKGIVWSLYGVWNGCKLDFQRLKGFRC